MSSGTVNTPRFPYLNGYYHEWSGDDGKYEIVDGQERLKWNSYSSYTEFLSDQNDWYHCGFMTPSVMRDLSSYNNLTLRLLEKLAAKSRGSSFNLGVTIGESREAISMITSNAMAIVRALVDVKHGNIASAARRLGVPPPVRPLLRGQKRVVSTEARKLSVTRDLSGRWLELQYGWLPLVSDSYEGAKAVERLCANPRHDWIRCTVVDELTGNGSQSPSLYSIPCTARNGRKVIFERKEILSGARIMGVDNPASIAWELVPYSFVIDWFIPIGTYLTAYAEIPKLTGRHCLTAWYECTFDKVVPVIAPYIGATLKGYSIGIARTTGEGTGALTVPLPRFKRLDQTLSGAHLMNALALATQALTRPRKTPII